MRFCKPLTLLHFALAAIICPFVFLACAGCDDDPVRPVETNTCWKALDSTSPGFPHSISPAWSPSGKYIAFVGFFDSCNDLSPAVYITERGGKSRRALNISGSVVRWLPPGDSVLIVNGGIFGGGGLIKYNIDTEERTPLGIQTRFPFFDTSPDGKAIYYEGNPIDSTSAGGIYRYNIATKSVDTLIGGGKPAISPDGLMMSLSRGPLYLYNFEDSSIVNLDPRPTIQVSDWTPDGNWIVYDKISPGEIWRTDLTGLKQFITKGFAPPSVSPDGRFILYTNISPDGFQHVWIVNFEGGGAREFIQ